MHLPDPASGRPLAAPASGPVTALDWQRWLLTVPERPGAHRAAALHASYLAVHKTSFRRIRA